MDKKSNRYYENTKNTQYNSLIGKLDLIKEKNIFDVIELGCGAGRDTIYLLKKRL